MNSKTISNGILRALTVITGVIIGLWFIYKIQAVIVYIVIAGVISLLGRPIVKVLRDRFKFHNMLAVIITMLLFFATITGLVSLFIPLIIEQGHNLSLLDINALQNNVESLYLEGINHFGLNTEDVKASLKDSTLMSRLNFSVIPEFLNSIITGFGSFSLGLFSVLFISFFFLKDSSMFTSNIITLFPKSQEVRLKKSFAEIRDLLSRYFGGLLLQLIILFTIYTTVLLIFGIDNAIVIASLCALLNVIPYVGPIISAFLIVLLTMSSNVGQDFSTVILPKTIYVMIGFIIAQLVDNFFSQPYIFSKSVKSHPLEIFIVIIIAGLLSGVVGLIVAIPVYTALKVAAKEFLSEYRIVKRLTKGL